jgi:hypothetical protein
LSFSASNKVVSGFLMLPFYSYWLNQLLEHYYYVNNYHKESGCLECVTCIVLGHWISDEVSEQTHLVGEYKNHEFIEQFHPL